MSLPLLVTLFSMRERLARMTGAIKPFTAMGPLSDVPRIYDQRNVPLKSRVAAGKKPRWTYTPRDLRSITTLVCHQTAVRGGFGARSKDVARFAKVYDQIVERDGAPPTFPTFGYPKVEGLAATKESWAEAMALYVRFLSVPYHGVSLPQADTLLLNHDFRTYTYHGDRSNRYSISWALDGKFPGDNVHASEIRWDVARLVNEARRDGCVNLRYVEFHRQHDASRAGDPGQEVARVIASIAGDLDLSFRPHRTTGSGKPVPSNWLDAH